MAPPGAALACGWFGKIASLGDFGARRLPNDFVQCCDDWLARGVAASRTQLGDDWLAVYLHAPLWRFAWSPGLAGPCWWLGVLMPSVDRVGRYFPLLAAQPADRLPTGPHALAALQAWYDHVAAAMLATLQPQDCAEAFDARLAGAPPGPAAAALPGGRSLAQRERHDSEHALDLPDWCERAAAAPLAQRLRGCSLWLAQGAPLEPAHLSLAEGLPAPERFADLLRGSW